MEENKELQSEVLEEEETAEPEATEETQEVSETVAAVSHPSESEA